MSVPTTDRTRNPPTVVAVFLVGDISVAIDVEAVRETVRDLPHTPVPLVPAPVVGIANLRGHVLAVTESRAHLGLEPRPEDGIPVCVLLEQDQRWGGLNVDSAVGIVDCDPSRWRPVPATIPEQVQRCAIAVYEGDTGLLVLLDVDTILSPKA